MAESGSPGRQLGHGDGEDQREPKVVEALRGVGMTDRLVGKGLAGLLGRYTRMQSRGMGGEERA